MSVYVKGYLKAGKIVRAYARRGGAVSRHVSFSSVVQKKGTIGSRTTNLEGRIKSRMFHTTGDSPRFKSLARRLKKVQGFRKSTRRRYA